MSDQTFLTRDGLKKLEEELNFLRTTRRVQVAERLHNAQEDGELIENAEYEDAKNEQAFLEGKILSLESMLSSAVIIAENDGSNGIVNLGSKVTIKESGGGKPEIYQLVGAAEANPKTAAFQMKARWGARCWVAKLATILR